MSCVRGSFGCSARCVIGTLIAMIFVNPLLAFITRPLTELGADTIAIGPTDTITIFFKVSITVGAVFAMPVIVYQIIAFISPGLYPNERRVLLLTLPGVMVLFFTGAAFAYFMLLPVAVGFLAELSRRRYSPRVDH